MTHTIGNVTFGQIKNVRKSGDEEGVYFADVDPMTGLPVPQTVQPTTTGSQTL